MTNSIELENTINNLWEQKNTINSDSPNNIKEPIENIYNKLNNGDIRVCINQNGSWKIQEWVKKSILLYFKISNMSLFTNAPQASPDITSCWYDKIPLKFDGWTEKQFSEAQIRAVPGSIVRKGVFIGKNVVLMPSFINIGAYVGAGTMVDTWATIGSCAQIGENCHISGGAGIGGVLEPLQANPVIIENNVFIGARSEVAEGVIVRENAVLSMGVFIGASTKIIDRKTGEIFTGEVPANAVVVPGSIASNNLSNTNNIVPNTYCAVIVKYADAQTRSKIGITALLREEF